jgi:DNA repair protein RadC
MSLAESVLIRPPHRRANRAKTLLLGADALSDVELLGELLGGIGVAESVLESVGGLGALRRVGSHELSAIPGVGPLRAVRVAAALELGIRATALELSAARVRIIDFEAVVSWARPRLATLDHEQVWLLCLDGQSCLKSARRIAQGGLHGCGLTARDVLHPAVRDAASAIVLVHNHPSGSPDPSAEDIRMTRALARACEVVGVALLDHVVVARGGASSLAELGALDSGQEARGAARAPPP